MTLHYGEWFVCTGYCTWTDEQQASYKGTSGVPGHQHFRMLTAGPTYAVSDALRQVAALHNFDGRRWDGKRWCTECRQDAPCATVRLIT